MKLEDLNITDNELLEGVKKLLQAETDRVRTEYSNKIKELEKYKPVEKTPKELELEKREKALIEKEKEIKDAERVSKVQKLLCDKGLNKELSKYLNINDETDLETLTDDLSKLMKNDFIPHNNTGKGNVTKEQFKKMSYSEQVKLYQDDKNLYNSLIK